MATKVAAAPDEQRGFRGQCVRRRSNNPEGPVSFQNPSDPPVSPSQQTRPPVATWERPPKQQKPAEFPVQTEKKERRCTHLIRRRRRRRRSSNRRREEKEDNIRNTSNTSKTNLHKMKEPLPGGTIKREKEPSNKHRRKGFPRKRQ